MTTWCLPMRAHWAARRTCRRLSRLVLGCGRAVQVPHRRVGNPRARAARSGRYQACRQRDLRGQTQCRRRVAPIGDQPRAVPRAQRPSLGHHHTSKVQGILAGARPIMGSMTGDAANVINRSGGWTSSPGDVDALVANLREVIAQVGVACYRVSGQRERSTQRSSPTTLPWRASRACSSRPHRGGVVADPRVVALRPEHIEQCVRLHRQAFPDFFLSQLGTRFLAEFYRAFRSAPDAARGVAVDGEGRVPGVVVGTTRPGGFFSRLLKQRWLALAWAYFELVLLRPSAIPRLLRAVRYRGAFHWTSVGRC